MFYHVLGSSMFMIATAYITLASISGENRPISFFANFSFWCNFEEFFDTDIENISSIIFFMVSEVPDVLLATVLFQYSLNCYLPATLIW